MDRDKITIDSNELEILNNGSPVILLRHANSQYNFEYSQLAEKEFTDEDYKSLRIKKDLRDAPLSELGIQQCMNAQAMANMLKPKYVIVSPLRRALETAYYTFNTHPNFDDIQFILLPTLKEGLDTACDIPLNIKDTIDEFKKKFKNFDTSELEKYRDASHFFFTDINQDFSKDILSEKVEDPSDPMGSNAFELTLESINQNFPKRLESTKNILSRIEKAKKFIEDFLQRNPLEDDSKIILVGHSCYFKYWTGKWEKEISSYNENIPDPQECVWLNNCQFYSDITNFSKNHTIKGV